MMRTRKLAGILLSLFMAAVFAMSTLVVSFAEGETASHGLIIAQLVEGTSRPQTVSGNYAIIPDKEEYPMPIGQDG